MDKIAFIKLITDYTNWINKVDKISDISECFLFESSLVTYPCSLFDTTLDLLFTEEGVSYIDWWLHEKSFNPDLRILDKEGNEIPSETLEDLWGIIKEFCK